MYVSLALGAIRSNASAASRARGSGRPTDAARSFKNRHYPRVGPVQVGAMLDSPIFPCCVRGLPSLLRLDSTAKPGRSTRHETTQHADETAYDEQRWRLTREGCRVSQPFLLPSISPPIDTSIPATLAVSRAWKIYLSRDKLLIETAERVSSCFLYCRRLSLGVNFGETLAVWSPSRGGNR
ncbi:hypothetical protein VTI28DRAFT_8236 [Corynascus sepedonium]